MKKFLAGVAVLTLALVLGAMAWAGDGGKKEKMEMSPEVRAAQEKVWDARLALYGAQHARALAVLKEKEAQTDKKLADPGLDKKKAEYLKKRKEGFPKDRAATDKAYDLSKKLVAAERAGDWDKVKSIHKQLREVREDRRKDRKGGWGKHKGGMGDHDGMPGNED